MPEPRDAVVLLDEAGQPIGTTDRTTVHTTGTPLHLAFSLYVVDAEDRLLLTRRALGKTAWPGVWTNSCCGHPRPGESSQDAARRRVHEELGLDLGAQPLTTVLPDFRYRAVDVSGVVENEVCPVHVVRLPAGATLSPDPAEVAELAWVPWATAQHLVAHARPLVSPWMALQVPGLVAALEARGATTLGALTRAGDAPAGTGVAPTADSAGTSLPESA
ncbi:isopentenyl-diphosphate Delta-isomerase [Nocardioides bruguierae]|uniref:isopentenyl-diphosphate Delta-isomerase n=1 Tax=Nocardioides bruguierae TaxID=2945102 RepID=UPI0020229197|nr:isopentenyl-diphosphate Delta-isomerase [Nocardioides bruguierae]